MSAIWCRLEIRLCPFRDTGLDPRALFAIIVLNERGRFL
jgi:hypothetical protein